MNITFLIGNGFDVSLGIQSSYSKFYEWYCAKHSKISHIETFRKSIDQEIKSNKSDEEKVWADFEVGIGQYTSNFTTETVDLFLDCFTDAQENIQEYLKSEIKKFKLDNFAQDDFLRYSESLWKFYDELSEMNKNSIKDTINSSSNENIKISFVTFNYTDTLETILSKIPDAPLHSWRNGSSVYSYILNREIIHVHGTIDNAPILGVNDETQIANKDLLETPQFREFLIKAESVKALGHLWQSQAETLISNSKIVCVLGMSLGVTDAKWWRKLNEWLKVNSSRKVIIFWYERNPPSKSAYIKELQCIDKVKEKLLSYSNFSDSERTRVKNQIYVVINTKKFMKLQNMEQEIRTQTDLSA